MSQLITFPNVSIPASVGGSILYYYIAEPVGGGPVDDRTTRTGVPAYDNGITSRWSNDSRAWYRYVESLAYTWSHWSSVFGGASPPLGGSHDFVNYWETWARESFFRIPQLDRMSSAWDVDAITSAEMQVMFQRFPSLRIIDVQHEIATTWTKPGPEWVLDSPGYVVDGGGTTYWSYTKTQDFSDIDTESWTLGLYGAKVNQTTGIIELTPLPAGDVSFLLDTLDPIVFDATNLVKSYLANRTSYTGFMPLLYPAGLGYDPLAIPAQVIIDATYTESLTDSGYNITAHGSGSRTAWVGSQQYKSFRWDNPILMQGRVSWDTGEQTAIGSGMVYEEIPANIKQ